MIVAEAWGWDEMGLTTGTTGGLAAASTDIEIVKPGHFLAAGLSGTVQVLNSIGSARHGTGIAGNQATVIARATLSDGQTYDVVYVYEKGAALPVAPADGSAQVAAEMRICFCFDELSVVLWNENAYALLGAAIDYAIGATGQARDPNPSDGQEDVLRDAVMGWTPAKGVQSHDLYLGVAFEDVNDADAGSPLRIGPGMDASTFDPGLLEFGQTYYWRVDEVGAPPESKIVRGDVWRFTVEAFARRMPAGCITATASSSLNAGSGPEKTVDGSGLNALDQHDTTGAIMWTSANGQQPPVWIQYEFDAVYKLDQMWVWNANNALEWLVGLGVKTVTIEYSTDGTTWTALANVPEFAQAPSAADYAHNTTVDFGGVVAKFVRMTFTSSWGGMAQYGLSEVRFFYIPVLPREPHPDTDATDVPPDTTLSWRAGREAALHEVYLGTDPTALTLAGTVSTNSYAPADLLLGTRYYWRVAEVNTAEAVSTWTGDVWTFTVGDYVSVDDFESYTNDSPRRLFQTWVDGVGFSPDEFFPNGYDGNGTGSCAGYDPVLGDIMERSIVHGGKQSMPFFYDNSSATATSETTRTFAEAQDWTRADIKTLTLYFYGDPGNAAVQLYVKINSAKVPYSGNAGDLTVAEWKQWNIDLPSGANLGSVKTLTLGLAGGQGVLYIDDIRLYRSAPAVNP